MSRPARSASWAGEKPQPARVTKFGGGVDGHRAARQARRSRRSPGPSLLLPPGPEPALPEDCDPLPPHPRRPKRITTTPQGSTARVMSENLSTRSRADEGGERPASVHAPSSDRKKWPHGPGARRRHFGGRRSTGRREKTIGCDTLSHSRPSLNVLRRYRLLSKDAHALTSPARLLDGPLARSR